MENDIKYQNHKPDHKLSEQKAPQNQAKTSARVIPKSPSYNFRKSNRGLQPPFPQRQYQPLVPPSALPTHESPNINARSDLDNTPRFKLGREEKSTAA